MVPRVLAITQKLCKRQRGLRPAAKARHMSGVGYSLYPNPNEGLFSIRQTTPSDKIVEAKIYNAMGRELQRETVQFRGGVVTFRLDNAMPGLYLICFTDENHKVVCLKFNVK